MARNTVRLASIGPGPSMGGNAEGPIWKLLEAANASPHGEWDGVLSGISAGKLPSLALDSTMSAVVWTTIRNLSAFVRAERYHLRRCRECARWYVSTSARRLKCFARECDRADARRRAKNSRDGERERQRRVLPRPSQ